MVEQIVRLPAELYALSSDHGNLKFFSSAESTFQIRLRSKNVLITSQAVTRILRDACSGIRIVNGIWIREELDLTICRVVNRACRTLRSPESTAGTPFAPSR